MKHKTLLLLSIFPLSQLYAQPENHTEVKTPGKAELRVSYSNLQELIDTLGEKAKPIEQSPPIPAAVRNVSYRINLHSKDLAELTASFAVSVFTNDWCELPLFTEGLPVSEIEPASTVIIPHEGMLCLLTEKAGEYKVTLKFLLSSEADGSFHLSLLRSVASQLHVENITGYEVKGAIKTENGSYLLPANSTHAKVVPRRTEADLTSSWSADAEVLYVVENEELQAEARIQLTAKQGESAASAHLHLPNNARIISVSGADLSSWKETPGNQLELQWDTYGISRRRITLLYSVPLPDIDETWSLAIPYLDKEQVTKGKIAVSAPPELQLSPNDPAISVDPASAPDWMKQNGSPFMVKLSEAKEAGFSCQRLEQLQTATATIQKATFRTQVVADGSTLSNGEITIQHRKAKPITLQLPVSSSILTCMVDNELTSPILLSDGSLQIHLPNKSKTGKQITNINISFTSKLNEIDPIEGKLSLALPSTPIFIHQLEWNITLPSAYEVTALEGNLEFNRKSPAPHTISLIKQLSRDQAAQTDIFYRKKNL